MKSPEIGNRSIQAMALEDILRIPALERMLQGDVGVFSVRYLFINNYSNLLVSRASNPAKIGIASQESIDIYCLMRLMRDIFVRSSIHPAELLFISRDRKVEVRSPHGLIAGDYLFYSIEDHLKRHNPDINYHMFFLDDGYEKFKHASPFDLIRSLSFSLCRSVQWRMHRNRILEQLPCEERESLSLCISSFYNPRQLLNNALLGYSIRNLLEHIRPTVIISNDDCIYTKLVDSHAWFIVLQSANVLDSVDECRSIIFQDSSLMPYYFLASGKMYAEIKEKHDMAKRIIVVGLPRYDLLYKSKYLYSKTCFLNEHGIDPDNKIVLWATQTHGLSKEENLMNLEAVFGAIEGLNGSTLIIKQHPAEGEEHTMMIHHHLDMHPISALIVPKDFDIIELVTVCDLMITRHSTTAMEAVALNKPIIILNLSGNPDPVDYVEAGVALGVYSEERLRPAIQRLLEDDSVLATHRQAYVEKHLYRIDGGATQRVVNIIQGCLHSKRDHEK